MRRAGMVGALLLLLGGCAAPEPTTRTVHLRPSLAHQRGAPVPSPLRFVPSESTAILRLDLAHAREASPYYETLTRFLKALEPFGRGGEAALIGLLAHTRTLYITVDAYRGHFEPRCLILSGDYERGQVEDAARLLMNQVVVANSFRSSVTEREVLVLGGQSLARLDDDYTWLFCENRVLDDALAESERPRLVDREDFQRFADDIGFEDGILRMVGVGAPGTRDLPVDYRALVDEHAASIEGFAWAMDLEEAFTLHAEVYTNDEATATALRETMSRLLREITLLPIGLTASRDELEQSVRVAPGGVTLEFGLDAEETSALMTRLNSLLLLSQGATRSH